MTCKVQITSPAKGFRASKQADHANHFRPLLIDGDRIEIGNFHIGVRPHRMSHRPGIFGELHRSQKRNILHALYGARPHVC